MEKREAGFSMVELMVVLLVVAILIAIGIPTFLGARARARVGVAESDLRNAALGVEQLVHDTGQWPNHLPVYESENAEVSLSDCRAGLTCDDAGLAFPNWDGPYASIPLTDPWGNAYWFDPDYHLDGEVGPALVSFGPNGSGVNDYDDDNVVVPLTCDEASGPCL